MSYLYHKRNLNFFAFYHYFKSLLLKRYKKNGAPNIAVTTPTGISLGLIAILPIVSANKTKNPPTIPLQGIKYLWSEPIIILQTCGTTNPTKDITPAIAVDILAKNTATAVNYYHI
mgnify:CR=1 FL=1